MAGSITRRDFGKMAAGAVIAAGALAAQVPAPALAVTSFTDVSSATDHAEDILWLAEQGVSTGFPDGTFRPYDTVKRCDMAAFLYRLAGSPDFDASQSSVGFADVTTSTDHGKEILWLAATGISAGWTETDGSRTFRPYDEIVRCDMAAFLYRLATGDGYNWYNSLRYGDGFTFSDVNEATSHYREVLWLYENKISTGYADGTFRPYDTIKRCDMAAFMHRQATATDQYGDSLGLVSDSLTPSAGSAHLSMVNQDGRPVAGWGMSFLYEEGDCISSFTFYGGNDSGYTFTWLRPATYSWGVSLNPVGMTVDGQSVVFAETDNDITLYVDGTVCDSWAFDVEAGKTTDVRIVLQTTPGSYEEDE